MHLALDRFQWSVLVDMIMNLRGQLYLLQSYGHAVHCTTAASTKHCLSSSASRISWGF